MIKTTTLLLVTLISICTVAQTNQSNAKLYNGAIELYELGNFDKAVEMFKRVYEKEPENIVVLFNLGQSYFSSTNGSDSAVVYFEKAISLLEKENYNTVLGIDLFMSAARAKQYSYKYQEAISDYRTILGFIDDDMEELKDIIEREIEISKNGIEFMRNPVKLEIKNLGAKVNSKYDDHSPIVNADESMLIFTSRRKSSYSESVGDGQFSEKIFYSRKDSNAWTESEIIKSIATRDGHESGLCLSADGTELYMLKSDFEGRKLYVSNFDGEKWNEPTLLPEGINSRFNETHVSISSDKSKLFFTSDRKGGFGGLDIYMVRKLPNGEWGLPINLGENINTPNDEETPMIHPNGKVLYFSSKGHNTMGDFDIFYSKMNQDSTWSAPINMGYPINTPDDDFFFVPVASENVAYMASSRFDDNYGGSDLYMIEYEEPVENKLAVVRGILQKVKGNSLKDVKIRVTEKGKTGLIGEFKPNTVTGKYTMILECDKDYEIVYKERNVELKKQELNVSKQMTYHNAAKSIEIDSVVLPELFVEYEEAIAVNEEDIQGKYTIQFLTLKKVVKNHKEFRDLDSNKITIYKCKDGNYRYAFGDFDNYKEAQEAKNSVVEKTGYEDAFIRIVSQLIEMKEE